VNNADGDPLVDDCITIRRPPMWNAHADADTHYRTTGWHEGRESGCVLLDLTYLSMHPDVKAASVDPLVQFDHAGWKTGADPSIAFDTNAYLAVNPDGGKPPARPAWSISSPTARRKAASRSRRACCSPPNGFDYVYYLQHNPDVAAAGTADPFAHFETTGWKEGRIRTPDSTPRYLRLCRCRGGGHQSARSLQPVWLEEGRDPSVTSTRRIYLGHYTMFANAHINPLITSCSLARPKPFALRGRAFRIMLLRQNAWQLLFCPRPLSPSKTGVTP